MNREDWNKLDDLLGKEGFGGYYDLVECLKDIARDWITDVKDDITKYVQNEASTEENFRKIISKVDDVKTIKSAVSFLHAFGRIRNNKINQKG